MTFLFTIETPACAEVAGTMTFAAAAVVALADERGLGQRDVLECPAVLQHDPFNTVDESAVSVLVESVRVGCLPRYLAAEISLPAGTSLVVRYQLHILRAEDKLQAKAFVWMHDGRPQWPYGRANPPALTSRERVLERAKWQSDVVERALAEGGARAAQFQEAMVDGVHFLQLSEPIKQLKREGRLHEALKWCYVAMESAEKGCRGDVPAPGYTWDAAIILRKLGDREQEIAVLQRWLEFIDPQSRSSTKIGERLSVLQRARAASPAQSSMPPSSESESPLPQ